MAYLKIGYKFQASNQSAFNAAMSYILKNAITGSAPDSHSCDNSVPMVHLNDIFTLNILRREPPVHTILEPFRKDYFCLPGFSKLNNKISLLLTLTDSFSGSFGGDPYYTLID